MQRETLTITLVGGPTALIEIGGLRLLTDPTFDDPQSYEAGGVTLAKTKPPAVAESAVGNVDLVLLSHDQHFDNLDHSGRAFLRHAGRVLTTVAGAKRLGGRAEGLKNWERAELETRSGRRLLVTATPARHGPVGIEKISGDVTGFALTFEDEHQPAIYISGDTVWYEGVAEVARRFDVRVAILFTGAAMPRGPFHVTMDSNDAIEAAHAFPQAMIMGIHNEGWAHYTQCQSDLVRAFSAHDLISRLQVLQPGVATALSF
ncbi:MAG TPA: MBL fold metallo-hydrolase [Beijerinckiaceae bacterium]|nr:MBL fold metallo-hydrolase [Beijerinckiaceae bacterium]